MVLFIKFFLVLRQSLWTSQPTWQTLPDFLWNLIYPRALHVSRTSSLCTCDLMYQFWILLWWLSPWILHCRSKNYLVTDTEYDLNNRLWTLSGKLSVTIAKLHENIGTVSSQKHRLKKNNSLGRRLIHPCGLYATLSGNNATKLAWASNFTARQDSIFTQGTSVPLTQAVCGAAKCLCWLANGMPGATKRAPNLSWGSEHVELRIVTWHMLLDSWSSSQLNFVRYFPPRLRKYELSK